jgi:hypothetical protein
MAQMGAEGMKKLLVACVATFFAHLAPLEAGEHADCMSKDPAKIGMTIKEVVNSRWGYPVKTSEIETAGHVRKTWIYEGTWDENSCSYTSLDGYRYLYFDNDILTAIQR